MRHHASAAAAVARYRPRRLTLRNRRKVTVRAIVAADAAEIVQAFNRLSADSRYQRFMRHKKQLDMAVVDRGVRPVSGHEFVLVAVVPAPDGIDIVGAARYVRAGEANGDGKIRGTGRTCEFAVTVAEDWRGCGLATELLASLIRRARRDGYRTIRGLVLAQNGPMLAVARRLHFSVEPQPGDGTVVHVVRGLQPLRQKRPRAR
jgi:RimJ/RimL family protein N-acetyltransferase